MQPQHWGCFRGLEQPPEIWERTDDAPGPVSIVSVLVAEALVALAFQ